MQRADDTERARLLMSLSQMTQDDPTKAVRLSELATAAGITLDQARFSFMWLMEHMYARGEWTRDGHGAVVSINVAGSDEAARLRAPGWRRWWHDPAMRAGVVGGLVGTVAGGLVVAAILKLI